MDRCVQVKVKAGEFVYHSDQVADKSSFQSSPVYLIIKGRAACRLQRNISFKEYLEGCYFGDFEVICQNQRLFSVQAVDDIELAIIDKEVMETIMKDDKITENVIRYKSLLRYIDFKIALKRIWPYRKITMQNDFWEKPENKMEKANEKISQWIDLIRGALFNHKYMRTPELRNKSRIQAPLISRKKESISNFGKIRSAIDLGNGIDAKIFAMHMQKNINEENSCGVPLKLVNEGSTNFSTGIGIFSELDKTIETMTSKLEQLSTIQNQIIRKHELIESYLSRCTCGAVPRTKYKDKLEKMNNEESQNKINESNPSCSSIEERPKVYHSLDIKIDLRSKSNEPSNIRIGIENHQGPQNNKLKQNPGQDRKVRMNENKGKKPNLKEKEKPDQFEDIKDGKDTIPDSMRLSPMLSTDGKEARKGSRRYSSQSPLPDCFKFYGQNREIDRLEYPLPSQISASSGIPEEWTDNKGLILPQIQEQEKDIDEVIRKRKYLDNQQLTKSKSQKEKRINEHTERRIHANFDRSILSSGRNNEKMPQSLVGEVPIMNRNPQDSAILDDLDISLDR